MRFFDTKPHSYCRQKYDIYDILSIEVILCRKEKKFQKFPIIQKKQEILTI